MSTVDSQLLVAATSLVEDVARPLWKSLDERRTLPASRATVAVIAVAAGLIAMDPDSQVLGLVAYAWAGLGASFGPAVLACLFWRHTTERGLVVGMIVGAAVTVIWRQLSGGIFELYEIIPAFIAGGGTILALSRESSDAQAVFDRLVGAGKMAPVGESTLVKRGP